MSLMQPTSEPCRYFSNTDTDAPQYTPGTGSYKTIIKACLVTGFGTTAAAGWTVLHEDPDQITLKRPSPLATDYVLKIRDGDSGTGVFVQNNPTSITDDTSLWSNTVLNVTPPANIGYTPNWHLIATGRGFILLTEMIEPDYASTSYRNCYAAFIFGDITPLFDSPPVCMLGAPQETSGSYISPLVGSSMQTYFSDGKKERHELNAADFGNLPDETNIALLPVMLMNASNKKIDYLFPLQQVAAQPKRFPARIETIAGGRFLVFFNSGRNMGRYYSAAAAVALDSWVY